MTAAVLTPVASTTMVRSGRGRRLGVLGDVDGGRRDLERRAPGGSRVVPGWGRRGSRGVDRVASRRQT